MTLSPKNIDPDTELFLEVKKGTHQAFRSLYQKYHPRILNLVFRFIPDRQEAEDVTQEVFLRVFGGAKTFSPEAKFSTWLYRVTVNRCFSHQKKIKREKEKYMSESELYSGQEPPNSATIENHPDSLASPNGQMLQKELREKIQSALDKLPSDQKMAFLLSQYEGLSYKEVARISGKSQKAVERQIYHARQKLKKFLRPYISE